ncbi:hypothetical protein VII00023_17599 [Vibrio ichthyoenteri ATCC 700023]|uniref:Uncharacterized protein n=1 Tax=Vibrio ichthyoenteri ATCC 700023 TaxID=870968 RepID=F9RYA1_9VIBR|nr:hypothetical protein [Vibrio ichthyoenteri]EGU46907.1 hypothetical protein VII00023_17599 [Vibrio ichthyoenteri ATCC 700023]
MKHTLLRPENDYGLPQTLIVVWLDCIYSVDRAAYLAGKLALVLAHQLTGWHEVAMKNQNKSD